MKPDKSELFLKAYQSKEDQRQSGLRSKFLFLCSQIMLEPVYDCGRWRAYITEDIFIEMLQDESLYLWDMMDRTRLLDEVWPAWVRECSVCHHHIPPPWCHRGVELSSDLATLLEQVGEYLDGAPKPQYMNTESNLRWIAKRHNEHLSLFEKVFGPEHGYYDLYPGLLRKLFRKGK